MAGAIVSGVIGAVAAPLAGGIVAVGLGAGGVFDVPQCCARKFARSSKRTEPIEIATRQSEDWPPGVSEESIEQCRVTNEGRQVTLTRTGEYSMRIEGLAPECMNFAALFTDEGSPIPCGTSCLDYVDLPQDQMVNLVNLANGLL
ncbi:uncharacterized protein J4E87_007702 [Alternaria ethzedia]|uniref:uncharacterized protein n=1 Tax=Alternaria ethzedia TaxID=181014 RepID=UPI0020C56312|nr:uncharacterized protein J4E87_007702 [Alternaria ethzedia]KAI4619115.1 hypothetical protein J4E87_007702 [Alternaria ethzedia]